MALTDPVADMLTIIRNASSSKKDIAEVKRSGITEDILKILKDNGFISNYKEIKDSKQGTLRVYLKYGKDANPAIRDLKRISKPSLRIYKTRDEVPKVYGGLGIAIISTSKGLMTSEAARALGLGGEVICYAW